MENNNFRQCYFFYLLVYCIKNYVVICSRFLGFWVGELVLFPTYVRTLRYSTSTSAGSYVPPTAGIYSLIYFSMQSAQFEDFLVEFLNRCFAIIENSIVLETRAEVLIATHL